VTTVVNARACTRRTGHTVARIDLRGHADKFGAVDGIELRRCDENLELVATSRGRATEQTFAVTSLFENGHPEQPMPVRHEKRG
jgi:hypothetical protein